MTSWIRTQDGWAVNLGGAGAAQPFTLPRVELHSSPRGWSCVCHFDDGTTRPVSLGTSTTLAAAKRAGIEGILPALGARYGPELRALLGP